MSKVRRFLHEMKHKTRVLRTQSSGGAMGFSGSLTTKVIRKGEHEQQQDRRG